MKLILSELFGKKLMLSKLNWALSIVKLKHVEIVKISLTKWSLSRVQKCICMQEDSTPSVLRHDSIDT